MSGDTLACSSVAIEKSSSLITHARLSSALPIDNSFSRSSWLLNFVYWLESVVVPHFPSLLSTCVANLWKDSKKTSKSPGHTLLNECNQAWISLSVQDT